MTRRAPLAIAIVAGLLALACALLLGSVLRDLPVNGEPPPVPTATVAPSALPQADTVAPVPRARPVAQGEVLATMRIPALGERWRYDVVEGIRPGDLDRGMVHYPGTPLPGQRGNAAFAGHRWAGPLYDFERLRVGDRIVVEQRGARWVYAVTVEAQRVLPSDAWVLDPVPGHEREPMLTLTTCWPKDGSSHREYIRARLIERARTS